MFDPVRCKKVTTEMSGFFLPAAKQTQALTAADAVAQSDVDPAGQLLVDQPQR